jgi:hypothetical protein
MTGSRLAGVHARICERTRGVKEKESWLCQSGNGVGD